MIFFQLIDNKFTSGETKRVFNFERQMERIQVLLFAPNRTKTRVFHVLINK